MSRIIRLSRIKNEIIEPIDAMCRSIALLNGTPLNDEQKAYVGSLANSADLLSAALNALIDEMNRDFLNKTRVLVFKNGTRSELCFSSLRSLEISFDACDDEKPFADLLRQNDYSAIFYWPENANEIIAKNYQLLEGIPIFMITAIAENKYAPPFASVKVAHEPLTASRVIDILNIKNKSVAKPEEIDVENKFKQIAKKAEFIPIKKFDDSNKKVAASGGEIDFNKFIGLLDIEKVMARLGVPMPAVISILKSFLVSLPIKIEALSQSQHTDIESYRVTVHGLKGALSNIGANDLSEMAYELEKAALRKDNQYIDYYTDIFVMRLNLFSLKMSSLLSVKPASEPPVSRKSGNEAENLSLMPLLEKILMHIDNLENLEAVAVLEEISTRNLYADRNLIGEIVQLLEIYDYQMATELVKGIIRRDIGGTV